MAKRIHITCDGVVFEGIDKLSEHYKLHKSTVARRLRDGWTAEQAVGLEPRKRQGHGVEVVHDGRAYRTIKDACIAVGLDPKTIRARIHKGYSFDDAARGNLKPRKGNPKGQVRFRDVVYSSKSALAKQYGQKASNVQRRIARGWTLEQALRLVPAPPRFRNHEGHARDMKWKTFRTAQNIAEPIPDPGGYKLYLVTNTQNAKVYIGITIGPLESRLKQHFAAVKRGRKSAFANAIKKYGEAAFSIQLLRADAKSFAELQEQEVVEIEARDSIRNGFNTAIGGSLGTPKGVSIDGKQFNSRVQAAEFYGIDPAVFNLRLQRLKWTPEESAGLVQREWQGKAKSVCISGVTYASVAAAAKVRGLNPKTVSRRTQVYGWSIEQALGEAPPPRKRD